MLTLRIRILGLLFLLCVGVSASPVALPPQESGPTDSIAESASDSSEEPNPNSKVQSDSTSFQEVLVDIRSRTVALMAWPFENVLQPVFGLAIYPLVDPLRYMNDHNLIDKGVRLISYGDDGEVFIYPTFNMKPGTESSIGMAYRHRNMAFDPDYFVFSANLFANGDWGTGVRYSKRKFKNTDLTVGGSLRYDEDRDRSFRVPGARPFLYADSSLALRGFISNPLSAHWSWEVIVGLDWNRFDIPDIQDTLLPDNLPFGRYERGFYQNFNRYPVGVWFNYDTRDATQAPTKGVQFDVGVTRIFVSDYSGSNAIDEYSNSANHHYMAFDAVFQHFLLLGTQTYLMTTKESRESEKQIRNMSLNKAMDLFKPQKIRQTLFDRKVLVSQFHMRQMWEDEPGMAPFVGLTRLGNNFPLRAYGNGSFIDYAAMGWSNEYRWPIARLVDGLVFNEYAVYGRSWNNMKLKNLKNSWGFGIRVRKPDLFLTRVQLAFHGLQGFAIILTVNPTY